MRAIGSLRTGIFGVALALLLWACPPPVRLPSLEDGRDAYRSACASCHGIAATGGGPAATALKAPPPDLTRLSQRYGGTFPHDLVIQIITGEREIPAHGSREMPVWCQRFMPTGSGATAAASIYERQQLEMLVRYLETIQRTDDG